jgi:hypothetical protein
MRVYEAVIYNHSDFGNVVFQCYYDSAEKAYGNGEENLEGFAAADPEYARCYELRVRDHEVR